MDSLLTKSIGDLMQFYAYNVDNSAKRIKDMEDSYYSVLTNAKITGLVFGKAVEWLKEQDDAPDRFPTPRQALAITKKYKRAHIDRQGTYDEKREHTSHVMHWVHIWEAIRFFGIWHDNCLFPGESVYSAQGRILRDLTDEDKIAISAYIKMYEIIERGGLEASAAKITIQLDYKSLPVEKRRTYFMELIEEYKKIDVIAAFDQRMRDNYRSPFKEVIADPEPPGPDPTYRREKNMVINEQTGEEDLPF